MTLPATLSALEYCELDILFCQLLYGSTNGVGTCSASVGVTGPAKCFNTRNTCQDPANLNQAPLTLRFARDTGYLPRDIDAIPTLLEVQYSPATISLGKSLGERASVTFIFRDHQWADTGTGFDKYRAERPYNPSDQGSFWAKLRARHRALRGRPIRWINGYLGQSREEMEVRHFVVESIDGPRRDGTFAIIAKDILKLADGEKSQTPPLTNGYLTANLLSNGKSFTAGFPAGFDNSQYPTAEHFVSIGGNEIIKVTRSSNVFTVSSGGRGQFGTTATGHSSGDRIQICRFYDAKTPSEILYDILVNDCGVNPSYIPLSDWELEEDTYLQRLYTRCIAEPIASKTAINSLIEQAGLSVWSDEIQRSIKMMVIRGVPENAAVFSPERNILPNSLSARDQPDTQITRCITRFALRTPLLSAEEPQSYRAVRILLDADAELIYESPTIREIAGTWIPALGNTTADRANELQVGRFSTPPRRFQFKVPRVGSVRPFMGMGARLRCRDIFQDEFGSETDTAIQITRVRPDASSYAVEAEEMLFKVFNPQDVTDRVILINTNNLNLDVLTIHNALYPALTDDDVSNGVNLTVIVSEGPVIGSSSINDPAIDIPVGWPTGFPITLEIYGYIQGAGGRGTSGVKFQAAGSAGGPGGPALRVRVPIDIRCKTGSRLWGGGGGGGSGGGGGGSIDARSGAGGGGAGTIAGKAGPSGRGGSDGSDTAGGNGGPRVTNGNARTGTGGDGGNPGLPGESGGNGRYYDILAGGYGEVVTPGGAGGAPGAQIDGISYVTIVEDLGDRRGPTI